MSAKETRASPSPSLNSSAIPSRGRTTVASWSGSLTSQPFFGSRRFPPPVAPTPLSVSRELAAPARPPPFVGPPEAGGSGPRGGDQLRDRQPGVEDLGLEGGDLVLADQPVVDRRNGVLPQLRLRNPGAQVARDRAHVPVEQLVP